ncbi:helix-turn-helix transcriptional regulator [bacterium]|nr:helix-turn-helix transcriptional regulator [bacterium]
MKVSITEQLLLLSIWRLDDQAYGFKIRELVAEYTGKDVAFGTLYNNLDQLIKKGYTVSHKGESTAVRGGKRKVYYQITEKGFEALQAARDMQDRLWGNVPKMAFTKGE